MQVPVVLVKRKRVVRATRSTTPVVRRVVHRAPKVASVSPSVVIEKPIVQVVPARPIGRSWKMLGAGVMAFALTLVVFTANQHFGTSKVLSLTNTRPCSTGYFGPHDSSPLSNRDTRFMCFDATWYYIGGTGNWEREWWRPKPIPRCVQQGSWYTPPTGNAWVRGDVTRNTECVNPVAAWDFESVSGSAVSDSSSNNNAATLSNATVSSGALTMNSANSFASVNSSASIGLVGNMTFSAWVNVSDFSIVRGIVGKTTQNIPNPYDWYLDSSSGKPRFLVGNGSLYGTVLGTNAPATGTWQHLAVVVSGKTITHYLNGVTNGTGTISTTITNNTKNLYIGSRDDKVTQMKGSMDDIILYQRALSAEEVKTLADKPRTVPVVNESPVTTTNASPSTPATTSTATVSTTATASLIDEWTFDDDNARTATNSIADAPSGSLQPGATIVTNGCKKGKCLQLNGTSGFVKVENLATGKDLTVSVWAKSDRATWKQYDGLLSARGPNGFILHPGERGSKKMYGYILNAAGEYSSISTPYTMTDITNFHHYVMTYDDTTKQGVFYIDGVKVMEKNVPTVTRADSAVAILNIGNDSCSGCGRRFFQGLIDEVKIYNRALTATEVVSDFTEIPLVEPDWNALGMVGEWKFDNGSLKDTKQDRDATNNGAVSAADRNNVAGGAYEFMSASRQYINAGVVDAYKVSQALTMEAWVNPTTNSAGGGIIVNKEGEYELARWPNGHIYYAIKNTTPGWEWVDTGYTVPLNTWLHLVLTYSAANRAVVLYANGQEVFRNTSTSGAITDQDTNKNELRIGGRQYADVQYIDGKIDTVRVYNTALTFGQVNAIYAFEIAPPRMESQSSASSASSLMLGNSMGTATIVPSIIATPDRLQFFAREGDRLTLVNAASWLQTVMLELSDKTEFLVAPSVRSLGNSRWLKEPTLIRRTTP